MGMIARILGPCRILVVSFHGASEYGLRLLSGGEGGSEEFPADVSAVRDKAGKTPLIVVVCGYGVIRKEIDAAREAVAKVMVPGSGFLWRSDSTAVTFMRDSQAEPFRQLKPLAILCCAGEAEAQGVAAGYYAKEARLKTILKPTRESSALGLFLARRIRMPLLCVALALLAGNAVVAPGVRNRLEAAQAERTALLGRIGKADGASRDRAQAVAELQHKLPFGYGWLCDRAAAVVPRDATLTSLSVQPLLKTIEEGRKPLFSEGEMVIAGYAPNSGSISEYAAALGELGIARNIRLSTVEFDREKGIYNFRINMEL